MASMKSSTRASNCGLTMKILRLPYPAATNGGMAKRRFGGGSVKIEKIDEALLSGGVLISLERVK